MTRQKKHQKQKNKNKKRLMILLLVLILFFPIYLYIDHLLTSWVTKQEETPVTKNIPSTPPTIKESLSLSKDVLPETDQAKEINQELVNSDFIGSALVIKNGQILFNQGYGYANAERQQPNTSNSLFQIGSIEKAMTATLILQQIEKKKLTLNDTIDKFYPHVPEGNRITIRHLLTMTSGLKQTAHSSVLLSDEEYLRFAFSHLKMEKHGEFIYDPINYYLLVGVLEKITDTYYKDLFKEAFIKKIHLSHTYFYNDFLNSPLRTYSYQEEQNTNYASLIGDNPLTFNQEVGTGNVATNTGDLYLFYHALLTGEFVDLNTLSSLWQSDGTGKYVGGAYEYPSYYKGHGVLSGFESITYISKDSQNAVILLSNQYPQSKEYDKLGEKIFQQLND